MDTGWLLLQSITGMILGKSLQICAEGTFGASEVEGVVDNEGGVEGDTVVAGVGSSLPFPLSSSATGSGASDGGRFAGE